jgi:hypothetical protein
MAQNMGAPTFISKGYTENSDLLQICRQSGTSMSFQFKIGTADALNDPTMTTMRK